ncbi:TNF receptor-associated factor 5-like [Oopsacas minuta]|uniref:TNF receptor-associated factor 5-like n=1 Tax=Oopsacas minuta TaxID=111878 RepID=A0AAV7K9W3_9METZ|nr:TNF receptor-associated factor 5-like [Oopsacas minuta]
MASKLVPLPDDREDLLYVKKGKKGKSIHCGYKRDYLARNLTEMEEGLVVCKVCSGIMREASISNGETTCLNCGPRKFNPVKMVHNAVNQLEIKCPILRDCIWNSKLSEAEKHLDNCNSFVLQCVYCKVTVTRGEYDNHKVNTCILREIECVYCRKQGLAKELDKHFEVCDKYTISCPNNCGEEFPRKQLLRHKAKCELEEISCPYTEYGCEAKSMLRRDLLAHKKEYIVEHTDMSLIEIQELREENKSFKKEKNEMKMEGKIMKQLDGVEWEIQDIDKLTNNKKLEGPIFYVNNYKLRLFLIKQYMEFGVGLRFQLNKIEGRFDKNSENAYITNYRIICVNEQDITQSYSEDGQLDFELCNGKYSELFGYISEFHSGITTSKPFVIRLYFEVNSQKPIKHISSSNEESSSFHASSELSDPFILSFDDIVSSQNKYTN